MKQFIYLDTDMVNSIIAQKDKGLVLETANEKEDTQGKDSSKGITLAGNGSASGGFWKFAQAQAEISGDVSFTGNKHSQTVLKEIATKTLHDAAFDMAYSYLAEEYDLGEVDVTLGSYVELHKVFEFVDLTYFDGLLSENGFISFLKKTEADKIQKLADTEFELLDREARRKKEQDFKKEVRKRITDSDKSFDDLAEMIKAIRCMIPYNRMLVTSNGYLIPLEDKYFRDNPETMGFKHGGQLTCIGLVTNVIGESSPATSANVFSQLQTMVNQALVTMLATKEKDLFVVHPIAVYYGQ